MELISNPLNVPSIPITLHSNMRRKGVLGTSSAPHSKLRKRTFLTILWNCFEWDENFVGNILTQSFSHNLKSVDMSTEMAAESMEIVTMAIDKHQATKNYEVTRLEYSERLVIKNSLFYHFWLLLKKLPYLS